MPSPGLALATVSQVPFREHPGAVPRTSRWTFRVDIDLPWDAAAHPGPVALPTVGRLPIVTRAGALQGVSSLGYRFRYVAV
jgi:hypothetical protein